MSTDEAGNRRRPGGATGTVALLAGLAAPAAAIGGAYLANTGRLLPYEGFRLFFLAGPLALLATIASIVALIRARGGRNRAAGAMGRVGMMFGVLTVAAVIGLVLPSADAPLINDITTDLEDPPAFVAANELPANVGRDMSYPAGFADQQRASYGHLGGKTVSQPPDVVFRQITEMLDRMDNVRIVDASPEDGRVEAEFVSTVFRFVDDVVIRVRAAERGSLVDVRSKSRDGKGDMGINASRIESLLTVIN